MSMRRLETVLIGLALLIPLALPAGAASDDPWTFEGGGWGHGIGLSQFGAKGMAEDGRNETQILRHYYSGDSALASLPGNHWTQQPDGLWIGLASNDTSVAVQAVGGSITVCQPAEACTTSFNINPGEPWVFEYNSALPNQCRWRHVGVTNTGYAACDAKVTQDQGTGTRIMADGRQHAHGTLRMTPLSSGFHTVLTIDLENYLYGLAEMPSSWHSEALQAQAIIGRSFAVATAISRGGSTGSGKLSSCGCHLRSTSSDQVYAGWDKESPSAGGAPWVAAVNGTEGTYLTHPAAPVRDGMRIVETYYSSSNGGASENNEDVWGGTPRPYLRSVDDPWSADPSVNPLATWSVQVTNAGMESALGWDRVFDAVILEGPPGVRIEFQGRDNGVGVTKILSGNQVRSILGTYGFNYQSPGTSSTAIRTSPYITGVVDPTVIFTDIEGSVFEDAITWLYEQNITMGCNPPANTKFCPTGKVTRGEMGVFLSRAIPLGAPSGDYFNDDTGTFWEGGANRMFESGISVGCGPKKYCGSQNLPREQMAVFLVRALNLPPTNTDYFIDDENSPFEDHINRIAAANITLGCNPPTNNKFCPRDTVTRGEMAAFFKRANWGG